jgi:K+-transporting ATPase A subunit
MKSAAILICIIFALSKAAAQDLIAPTNHIEFFKVITDAKSEQYAVVNTEKTIVALKDKNGGVIWSTNVAKYFETNRLVSGERKIYSMQLFKSQLAVQFGRAWANIDIQSGKITGWGQN